MRGWTGKFLITVGLVLACLAIGEVVARSLPEETMGFRYDRARSRFTTPVEFQRDMTLNSLGFHDEEPVAKTPGQLQVMLLGDAYVTGNSVSIPLTVGARARHHLGEIGIPAQVVSIGKPYWGQRDEIEALREYGPRIEPDVVITLVLPLNDVQNNSDILKGRTESQQRDPSVMFRPGWLRRRAESMPLFWVERSVLNQWLSHRLVMRAFRNSDRGEASIPVDYFVYSTRADEEWERAWDATEALIVETAQQAASLEARYGVVVASTPQGVLGSEAGLAILRESYPAMNDLEWDLLIPERRLEDICRRHGIPFLALAPRFRSETETGRRLHWRFDGHWNAEGNDLAGELLAGFIRDLAPPDGESPRQVGEDPR